MNDSRGQIGNGVGGQNEADDEDADRPRQAVTDLDSYSTSERSGEADECADGDEFENSVARRVVVGTEHPWIITRA